MPRMFCFPRCFLLFLFLSLFVVSYASSATDFVPSFLLCMQLQGSTYTPPYAVDIREGTQPRMLHCHYVWNAAQTRLAAVFTGTIICLSVCLTV